MLGSLLGLRPTRSRRAVEASIAAEDRFRVATPLRRTINKVFPDHWSFMLGEIALYSFVMLLLTGTLLAFFFDPSLAQTTYHGSYAPLRDIPMTAAYRSTLDISFDVRGGLLLRQMHHWAANLFMAAIIVHMLRIFFTGVFRKPRDLNWLIGLSLFWLGFMEGFCGYSLPDDGLSGTGLRIADSIMLSIPVAGSWLSTSLFGGEFPGTLILSRLYIAHVFLIPGALLALISVHLGLIVMQKHTQWHRPDHTRHNVVGTRMVPNFAISSTGLAVFVFAAITLLGGVAQINPVWLWGPYEANVVTANAQPDWYVWFLEGAMRLFPAWDIRAFGYTVPAPFWPAVVLPGLLAMLSFGYPWLERLVTGEHQPHQLAARPRDAPGRTALGAMALTFYLVLACWAADDTFALKFHIDLNALVWAGRFAILLLPPLAFYTANRLALNLQQHDRMVLHEGIETGLIRRTADGRYVELRQPIGPVDEHGHGRLAYADWVVPKRPNEVLRIRKSVLGFFVPLADGHPEPPQPPEFEPPPAQPTSAQPAGAQLSGVDAPEGR
ncbi:ubiquinol-cytochrome c reductase cytochrome b subunit [Rugosimonospora acidiphila]|uniref:Cytochrome bc1 complex cytochrome b subunit n=1 Tax=Rugosimonospora acidiphila TaxID=556531 RepID=A0ABP9SR56_9ACTN